MSQPFFDTLSNAYQINLSSQQKAGVLHTKGPCLLLAVPGGGKTTTLLSRTAYLILHQRVKPSSILSLTFSKASARDMLTRFENIFGADIREKVSFSTIHAFAYKVVLSFGRFIKRTYTLIEGQQQPQLSKLFILRQIYHSNTGDYITEGELEILISDISYVKNMMYSKEEVKHYKSPVNAFFTIYTQYETIKENHNYIDYDDMLVLCYEIFLHHPDILKGYQDLYQYIQVDEAQDTSKIQHAIIGLLAGKHRNIFYVADDDQSIYGFRAAVPEFLLRIDLIYPEVIIYKMEENYRSTKNIVAPCNQFIKTNKHRYNKEIVTHNALGDPIQIIEVNGLYDQYHHIINQVKTTTNFKNYAVLFRNNDTAVLLAQLLDQESIPFYIKDFKRQYFDHWLVKDLLAIMEFAIDSKNLESFADFYYKFDGFYITKVMVESIRGVERSSSVLDRLLKYVDLSPHQRRNVTRLRSHLKELAFLNTQQGIIYIIEVLGYQSYIEKRSEGSIAYYNTLINKVEVLKRLSIDARSIKDLKNSIANLEGILTESNKNQYKNALTLSTAHSSKGLEWPRVFIVDAVDAVFPSEQAVGASDPKVLEEERRLFYVAMTRAKETLTLYSVALERPSCFVEEMEKLVYPKRKRKNRMSKGLKQVYGVATPAYLTVEKPMKQYFKPLMVGTWVEHLRYGRGQVVSCDINDIRIDFGGLIKRMKYQYLRHKNLIQIE